MKRIIIAFTLAALLPCAACAATKTFSVSSDAYCPNYNHVGNSWEIIMQVNGTDVSGGRQTVTLSKPSSGKAGVEVFTRCTERDKSPDTGEVSEAYEITEAEWENGFTVTQEVTVTENKGRYKGCACTWEVNYTFTPKR